MNYYNLNKIKVQFCFVCKYKNNKNLIKNKISICIN